jgi:hypothetical protein
VTIMGRALDQILGDALGALIHRLDAQEDRIRDVQERLDFFERGYRPRQPEVPTATAPIPETEAVPPVRIPLDKAIIVVEALLQDVGVSKNLEVLAGCLGVSQSSAGKTLSLIRRALPDIIQTGKSGPLRIFYITKQAEQRARAWLAANKGQEPPILATHKEAAIFENAAGGGFTITLPTGKIWRSLRKRDLPYRASRLGYAVEDRTSKVDPTGNPEELAKVLPLRSVSVR